MIDYGMNSLWVTPIKRQNLLDDGLVDQDLHRWLEHCAERPEVTPRDYDNLYMSSQMFQRHNQERSSRTRASPSCGRSNAS